MRVWVWVWVWVRVRNEGLRSGGVSPNLEANSHPHSHSTASILTLTLTLTSARSLCALHESGRRCSRARSTSMTIGGDSSRPKKLMCTELTVVPGPPSPP